MAVIEDLVISAQRKVDINGVTRRRIHYVDSLDPTGNVFQNAEAAIGIFYGYPHPQEPSVFATEIIQEPWKNSRTQVRQTVTYRTPDFSNVVSPKVSFTATTRDVETNFDIDGKKITVDYTVNSQAGGPPQSVTQVGLVSGLKACGIYEVEMEVGTIPTYGLQVINCLNSSTWNGGAKYTWLCRCFEFWELLYRPAWHIRAIFEYDQNTHFKIAAYRNIYGVVPEDIDDVDYTKPAKNGWTRVRVSGLYNFNTLPVPTIF